MQRTRTLPVWLLPSMALAALVAGCVDPHLEGLATAECATASDCASGLACLAGECRAPEPMPDGAPDALADRGPDARPDAVPDVTVDGPPDEGPDVELDLALDMTPDVGPDVALDGPPDVAPDLAVDMAPDLAVDMRVDAACVPMDEVCNGEDDDCDGRADEDDSPDPLSPLCPQVAGASIITCGEGVCSVRCAAGRVDVDRVFDNGCECVVFGGFDSRDLPEPLGIDADCDGTPGEAPVVLYVDPEAPADGDGTVEAPFARLEQAAEASRGMLQAAILMAPGDYVLDAPLVVGEGRTLVLVGGFRPTEDGWRHTDVEVPLVQVDGGAHSPAVEVSDGAHLALDGIELLAAGTSAPVGVRGRQCAAIELTDSVLEVTGPIGAQAEAEHDGLDGRPGDDAVDSAEAGADGERDIGGAGGENPTCPITGGGQGGSSLPGLPGDQGEPAADGIAQGGPGAADADTPARPGSLGRRGADGDSGRPASPAGEWNPLQAMWIRGSGQRPTIGEHGHGGGGGGGGFGQGGQAGGGGGGGGAGGCGGLPGTNGLPGFGAFGIVTVGGCAVIIEDSVVRVAPGGDGGDGAAGGAGAPGRAGGGPAEAPQADQAAAGGGDGGDGGCGGDGSGGPGGPSVGILRVGDGPVPVVLRSEVQVAEPSAGGVASVNMQCPRDADGAAFDGAAGISLVVGCCPEEGGTCGDLRCDPAR